MTKKLKVGIVGLGAIGAVHADAYQASGCAEIVGLCDIEENRLNLQGDRLNVAGRFKNYADLMKTDAEAISVCVGNTLHREVAVAAFQAGKHVLLEKPMAMNGDQAAEIIAAGEKAKKTLQIGMVWRQNAAARVLREYITSGQLGEIYHLRAVLTRRRGIPGLGGWFTTKAQSGGGPIIDIGVHWFDMSMWLSGLWKPTKVSAMTYAKFGPRMKDYRYVSMWAGPPNYKGVFDVEDYATGLVRYGDKATMSFEISWAGNAPEDQFIEVLGTEGGARVLDGKQLCIMTEHHGNVADISPKYDESQNMFQLQALKFAEACRGNCPPAATGQEGLVVMRLIDAIYESGKSGKEVDIKI